MIGVTTFDGASNGALWRASALPATAATGSKSATPVTTRTVVEKQSANNTLAVIALIVGLLGLLAGAAGLAVARRARGGQRIAA